MIYRNLEMSDPGVKAQPEGPSTQAPFLRQACFDDYDQIAAVQTANRLTAKPRKEWLHLWQGNPAFRHIPDWPIGWVLEDHQGRIVGSLENLPCLYRFRGRTLVGAFGRGWAVHPRYRAYALLLLLRQLQQPGVDLRVTNTASPRTSAVLSRQGWLRIPVGKWDRSALWVASYSQILQEYLAPKTRSWFSDIFGRFWRVSLLAKESLSGLTVKLKTGLELRWCTRFDERFEQFWTELVRNNPDVLLLDRSQQALEWHYKHGLSQNRIWILTVCDGPRLVAYAIFERKEGQRVDVSKLVLVDFQSLENQEQFCPLVISCALKRCRKASVPVLENVGCWLEAKCPAAKRARFHRTLGGWSYLFQASNPELASALRAPETWYPTQYDADASL
jgi:hypothetical protein